MFTLLYSKHTYLLQESLFAGLGCSAILLVQKCLKKVSLKPHHVGSKNSTFNNFCYNREILLAYRVIKTNISRIFYKKKAYSFNKFTMKIIDHLLHVFYFAMMINSYEDSLPTFVFNYINIINSVFLAVF
jgi:hypothetical protein